MLRKELFLSGGGGSLGPYLECKIGSEIVERTFYNYTGSIEGNRVYMKQFDKSAPYHLMIMVEGSSYDGSTENLERLGESPYSTFDVFTNWYFRIIDFTKNAYANNT